MIRKAGSTGGRPTAAQQEGRARLRLVAALVLALTACDSPTAPTVGLDENFVLAPGESAVIAETGIRLRFVGVDGDSRCPADVLCVQGGDALVRVELLSFGAGVQSYEFHTAGTQPVVSGSLTIVLVQLAPYPFSSRTIQPGEYRATFRATERTQTLRLEPTGIRA
jgi:hypothetical protein